MNELYKGVLPKKHVDTAIMELTQMTEELRYYRPEKVVWDIEDLSKRPPWGDRISSDITDLSNYFVTSDGEDFIGIFNHALEKARELDSDLEIKSL